MYERWFYYCLEWFVLLFGIVSLLVSMSQKWYTTSENGPYLLDHSVSEWFDVLFPFSGFQPFDYFIRSGNCDLTIEVARLVCHFSMRKDICCQVIMIRILSGELPH